MKWIGKHPVFSDLLIGGVLLSPPDNQYSYELTLPNDDGTTGQVLTTDGNGVLTWTTPSSGTPITLNGTTVNGIATYASANTLDIESTLTYTSTILTLSGTSAANLPAIILQNDHAGSDGANIQFNKIQDGSDDDELGIISWFGDDDAGNQAQFASITGRIADASNNDEAGKLELKVKTNSTENQQALIATGDGTSSKVDVGIAHGAASTTAIAGEVTLGVDLAITHGGTGASTAQAAIDALTQVSGASAGEALIKDGSGNATWAAQTNTTYTAGDGLDLSGTEFSTDVKANSGIIIDSTELSMNLGASNIQGTLAIGDGGTGQTTQQGAIDALTAVSGASTGQRLTKDGSGNATWADATTGTTINGTTTNGVATYGGANTIDIESTLTYASNTLTIGLPTNTSPVITTPSSLAGQAGDRLTIMCAASGSGTDISAGQQIFDSGIGTGSSPGGMYTFMGAPAANITGGSGTSRPEALFKIYAAAGAASSAFTQLFDVNDIRNYFTTEVKANGQTNLTTVDNASHNADLAITADGAVDIISTDASNDITLNSAGEIELNADGGIIDFKDDTAQLARINADGLSFRDNLGAKIIFEGSTDDANFTFLEVADPTGARTITLPDATGTVALQQRMLNVISCGWYSTSTSKFWLPLHSTTSEVTTTNPSHSYYQCYLVAPYDGSVVKIRFASSSASSATMTTEFHINASATKTGSTYATAAYGQGKSAELAPTDWTFSKGDTLFFSGQTSAAKYGQNATITFEYDTTT
tara:strand:+ start:39 stop:2327 length:2289 start_codon:yes stop_codon:yes gene_type:complete